LDAGKGYAAVRIAVWLLPFEKDDPRLSQWLAISALLAVAGHVFSVWLRFRGGKGVATALGAFLCINPTAVLLSGLMFLVLFAMFRRVSLASILALALFPAVDWVSSFQHNLLATTLKVAVCLIVIAKHHENIHRLITGTEPRFSFGSK
jgi:glycerol-3-phosphate acyltransferase PlsY